MNKISYRYGVESAISFRPGKNNEMENITVIIVPDGQEKETVQKAHAELRRRDIPVATTDEEIEEIRKELINNKPLFRLMQLSKELGETYSPKELERMRERAENEDALLLSEVRPDLMEDFWAATITYAEELAGKSSRQDPCEESEPAVATENYGSGTYTLTEADKDYLRSKAVDGVIPFLDYTCAMTEILNGEVEGCGTGQRCRKSHLSQ